MNPEICTDKLAEISQNYVMEKRRVFKPEEKAKIALEVLREEKTLTEIAAYYEVQ